MISEELRSRIRRLFFAEHWKIGTIASELGGHRDTVALAVEASRFATARFQSRAMLLDPYPRLRAPDARAVPPPALDPPARDDSRSRLRGQRVSAPRATSVGSAPSPRTKRSSG